MLNICKMFKGESQKRQVDPMSNVQFHSIVSNSFIVQGHKELI